MRVGFLKTMALVTAASGMAVFPKAGGALATVLPVGGEYTTVDWVNLDRDSQLVHTPLGDVHADGAGGIFIGTSAALSGETAVTGVDSLEISIRFVTHQILFNFLGGNAPSEITVNGVDGAFSVPISGASSFDYYSAAGISFFAINAIAQGLDTAPILGTLFVSDDTAPLNGTGFDRPDLDVPEPAWPGALALAMFAPLVLGCRGLATRRLRSH